MKFPGFNAEASVYRTMLHYHDAGEPTLAQASVLPLFIRRCPDPGPPTVAAYWQSKGDGTGTVTVLGENFVGGSTVYVTVESCPVFSHETEAFVWGLANCSPGRGCCRTSEFFASLPCKCPQLGQTVSSPVVVTDFAGNTARTTVQMSC